MTVCFMFLILYIVPPWKCSFLYVCLFLLEHSWCTVSGEFQAHSRVIQLYTCIYIYIRVCAESCPAVWDPTDGSLLTQGLHLHLLRLLCHRWVLHCWASRKSLHIYIHIYSFSGSLPYRLLQNTDYSLLCYTMALCFKHLIDQISSSFKKGKKKLPPDFLWIKFRTIFPVSLRTVLLVLLLFVAVV